MKASELEIRLLGTFALRVGPEPVTRLSHAAQAVVASLLMRRSAPLDRSVLATLLWPEVAGDLARFYLRRTLTELRLALGSQRERLLAPGPRTLALALEGVVCDLVAFEDALARGDLAYAVTEYRGALLEGWSDEWTHAPRAEAERACLEALRELARRAQTEGQLLLAARYLRQAVALDLLHEESQRALMGVLIAAGDPASAVAVYAAFRQRLRELALGAPSAETEALYRRARHGPRPSSPLAAVGDSPALRLLPVPLTRLVGRDAIEAQIVERLGAFRLVTLVGPGGVGKTRLAIAVAGQCARSFDKGAAFVDLAALTDPALVAQAVGQALELDPPSQGNWLAALRSALQGRLLVLDNAEHLIEACATLVRAWLGADADLRVLVTSRQPLRVTGECLVRIPPLDPEASLQLFRERALALAPDFRENGEVSRICALLDGIPLAIEMAASWVGSLPVAEIERRLGDRFALLTRGGRDLPGRQRTLKATLDWSWQLLEPGVQELLARLCVFRGGFSWEAVTAVSACPAEITLERLTRLVDHSLVMFDPVEGGGRYRMLETVRQYAEQQLGRESDAWERRNAFFLALARRVPADLPRGDQTQWFDVLAREHDNFRATLGDSGPAARLEIGVALHRFWLVRGFTEEGLGWLAAVDSEDLPTAARIAGLRAAASLRDGCGDFSGAIALFQQVRAIRQEIGDRRGEAECLADIGYVLSNQGRFEEARRVLLDAQELFLGSGDDRGAVLLLPTLGYIARMQADLGKAREYYERALALSQERGDRNDEAFLLANLGCVYRVAGELAQAKTLLGQSVGLHREIQSRGGEAWALASLAEVALDACDSVRAEALLEKARALNLQVGHRAGLAWNRALQGQAALDHGRVQEAIALLEEALPQQRATGSVLSVAQTLRTLGDAHRIQRVWGEARRCLDESQEIFSAQSVRAEWIETRISQALLALAENDPTTASSIYAGALAARRALGLGVSARSHCREAPLRS